MPNEPRVQRRTLLHALRIFLFMVFIVVKFFEVNFFTVIVFSHGIIFLSRNARKRRGCAGVPFGIYIAHKFHECLSLRDRFFSHRLHRFYRFFILIIRFALLLCKNRSADLHRFYRCAMFFFAHKFHKYHEYLLLCDSFFCRFY